MTNPDTPEAVERFNMNTYPKSGIVPDPNGSLVRFSDYAALSAENAKLKAEVEVLHTAGIAEIAARNPSVMEYMEHWEGRAEKAEAAAKATPAPVAVVERVARAWASMDGKADLFDKGKANPRWDLEEGPGHYAGYIADAEALIERANLRSADEVREEERERCAKIADAHLLIDWLNPDAPEVEGANRMKKAIAAAIRAGGKQS